MIPRTMPDLVEAGKQLERELSRIYLDIDGLTSRAEFQAEIAAAVPESVSREFELLADGLRRSAETMRELVRSVRQPAPVGSPHLELVR